MKKSHVYLIYIYKQDLALDKLQQLICHKAKLNQTELKTVSANFVINK